MAVSNWYEFYFEDLMGGRKAEQIVHKFGHNPSVGTSYVFLSQNAAWRTPQVSGATKLRIKAGNAADTAAGAGARTVEIEGRSVTGAIQGEVLTTNGTSAGADSEFEYIRLHRAFIKTSGTYATATQDSGSQAADVVIENAAGTEDWAVLDGSTFTAGQSQIAAYMVPLGYDAFVLTQTISADRNKISDVAFMQRRDALQTAAPYSAARLVAEYTGISSSVNPIKFYPLGPFPELTDLYYMAKTNSGTADISVEFEIALVPKAS